MRTVKLSILRAPARRNLRRRIAARFDAFGLIHDDFFDHLVLLPAVQLQKGNPAHVTHAGDAHNYTVDYNYTYDSRNRPLTRRGDLAFLIGPDAGQHFQLFATFSYYE